MPTLKLPLIGVLVAVGAGAFGQSYELERRGYQVKHRIFDLTLPRATVRTMDYRKGSLRVNVRLVRAIDADLAKKSFDIPSAFHLKHREPLNLGQGLEVSDYGSNANYYANVRQGLYTVQISFQDLSVRTTGVGLTQKMVQKQRTKHLSLLRLLVKEQLPIAKTLKQP